MCSKHIVEVSFPLLVLFYFYIVSFPAHLTSFLLRFLCAFIQLCIVLLDKVYLLY